MPDALQTPSNWSDAEQWAWREIQAGRIANFNTRYDKKLDPKKPDGWVDQENDRRLSQSFLVAILTKESYRNHTSFKGVQIRGACFEDTLDLEDARLEWQLGLEYCRFQRQLNLIHLRIKGWLSFKGSWFGETIDLSGTVADGAVSLEQVTVLNHVSLTYARISDYLVMTGSSCDGRLNMNSTEIGRHFFINDGAAFKQVDLKTARIGGQLNMTGSTFDEPIEMNGIQISQHLFMNENAAFNGVNLNYARIGGGIDMSGSRFDGLLTMNGIEIAQNFYAQFTIFTAEHEVSLNFAKIGSTFDLSGATICEIDLTGSTITADLRLGSAQGHEPTNWTSASRMRLRNTTVGSIQDADTNTESWPRNLELEGFSYHRLGGLGAAGSADIAKRKISWFIEWLNRDNTFSPQPYQVLADILRESGYPSKANAILYAARERMCQEAGEKRKDKPREYARWIGLTLLKATIGYGLGTRYFRVLWWFGGITLLGFFVLLGSTGESNPDLLRMAWASFDLALPIVTLNDGHEKFVLEHFGSWTIAYFYLHKLIGYVLGGFLAGGLAGLTQRI